MLQSFQAADNRASLRQRALAKLTVSTLADPKRASMSDALVVLHHLASSPATASDALALLHELQVHQVELELQAEELRESRAELESMLRQKIALYDHQPVGCFTIDRGLAIEELNLHGAGLLGVARDEACGQHLDAFLSTGDGRRLRELLTGVAPGAASASAPLQLLPRGATGCKVRAHVTAEPDGRGFLLVLAPAD